MPIAPCTYPVVMVTVGVLQTLQPFRSIRFCFQILLGCHKTPTLLFSQHLFCWPLLQRLPPCTVPCKIVSASPAYLDTCPNHNNRSLCFNSLRPSIQIQSLYLYLHIFSQRTVERICIRIKEFSIWEHFINSHIICCCYHKLIIFPVIWIYYMGIKFCMDKFLRIFNHESLI